MKRIVFTPGVGQIVNAAAALTQAGVAGAEDVLVLFSIGRYTEWARAMEQSARCLWTWKTVVWAEDVLVSHFPTRRFAPIARAVLRERLGPAPDEIWVSKIGWEATKLALHACPDSRVVIFEDGAEEFIPQEVLCGAPRWKRLPPSRWPGALRRELSHWTGNPECLGIEGVCVRDRRRVSTMYSFLAPQLGRPAHLDGVPVTPVQADALKGRLEALSPLYDPAHRRQPGRKPGEQVVLFLPQPFADLFLTPENEYALYRAAAAEILGKGYTMLWKDHPREITPLAPRLQEEFGSDRIRGLRVRQQMPVECLVAGWDLAAVASVSSTSLFTLKGLYGYPAYTAAGLIGPECWLKRSDAELAKMFIRVLPGLDRLPAAS
ncbi:MAG: hypothetical protein KA248_01330 [Kiritimatiellae bacterium]|nr:hypothetical protein [Kiritimatiellia bacterium]